MSHHEAGWVPDTQYAGTDQEPHQGKHRAPELTAGELASMRERSRIAMAREAKRLADEAELIRTAVIAILTALAES